MLHSNRIRLIENLNNVNVEKLDYATFEGLRSNLIIELGYWITPIMNDLHKLNYSPAFWTRILRFYLKAALNRKHHIDNGDYHLFKRYFISIDGYSPPPLSKRLLMYASYVGKGLNLKLGKKEVKTLLTQKNVFNFGHRAKELSNDNGGFELAEYYPLLLMPDFDRLIQLRSYIEREQNQFLKAVLAGMPRIYVELFGSYFIDLGDINFEGKVFHLEHVGSLTTEIIIGHAFDNGSTVLHYQGGCSHGETPFAPEPINYKIATYYVTYGWRRNTQDLPGRAYRLESFEQKYRDLSLNSSLGKKIDLLLVLGKLHSYNLPKFREYLMEIDKSIDRVKYEHVVVKPRPISRYIRLNRYYLCRSLGNYGSRIRYETKNRDMVNMTIISKVNVLLYTPATNLYECLSSGHPCIGIDMYENTTREFQRHLDFFIDEGIMHKSVYDMVNFLNDTDLDSWWEGVQKSQGMKRFLIEYCGSLNTGKL